MKKLTIGEKHEKFVTAVIEKDSTTARKLSQNSFKADRLQIREVESQFTGLEQWQKDAIWNYLHGNSEQCLRSLPKKKRLDTSQS